MSELSKGVLVRLWCAVIADDAPIPSPVALFYTKDSPFQVTFMADQNTETGQHVEWNYSRELLFNARYGTPDTLYGEGDVQTFQEQGYIYTIFHQGEKKVLIAFNPEDIAVFLEATINLCPMGAEQIDTSGMDDELARLLGDGSAS